MAGSSNPAAARGAREASFAVGIEPDDRIGKRLDRRARFAVAVGVALADDDAAFVIEHHRDRVDDDRVGGDQLDFEIPRQDEVLYPLLGAEALRDRFIHGVRAVVGRSTFFSFWTYAPFDVPRSDGRIAEHDGVEPSRVVVVGLGPSSVAHASGSCDLRLLVGDDKEILLVGGLDVKAGDGAGDASLIGRLDGEHILADDKMLDHVVLLDGAPFAVFADFLAVDVRDVNVIDGDP